MLSSLDGVKIRPRLLIGSLVAAVALIAVVALVWSRQDDDPPVDARLDGQGSVETFPADGLGNDAVEGEPFPDVMLVDRDGNEIASSQLVGEPLVVNLWFSSCPPCAQELPEFAEVDAENDDVRFVGVNTIDSVEVMERFAGERGVTYDQFRDEFAEFTDAVGAVAFPLTLFVTSDGLIVDQTGVLDADGLRERIANLLELDASA